ncbi:MAG TPA: molybdopterin-dependent oxidoreductase [Dongiaceae bacterium]|jgi:anaerobic selenocysteine-containing dehydrogenase
MDGLRGRKAGTEGAGRTALRERIRTTCPRDCYDTCGIVVIRRGDHLRVAGDPEHPVSRGSLCTKCSVAYNGVYQDKAARLTQPLRRVGQKGEGRFEAIGWDEALAIVADRLKAIARQSGPDKIFNAHYTGARSLLARDFPMRFFNRLGATEVTPETICNIAGQIALKYVYGTALTGFDPRTAKDASCIVVWGANPSATAPHAHRYWLPQSGAKIIVVDPIRHTTAEMADLHLQPYPGTDAALAFAMLHVLQRDGFCDETFIANHVVGWEAMVPLIARSTPGWAEEVTGVPATLIEQAAEIYGTGPSLLWMGMGLQRQRFGGNVVRAISALPAATGNIGCPGTGFFYINGSASHGIDPNFLTASHLARGPAPQVSHMDLVSHLADSEKSAALFCWNINIAATNPQQAPLRQALSRPDLFSVVVDLFATDTTDYADIVLPAAGFFEFDDLLYSYFHLTVGAQVKVTDAPGQALPNQEIFRRLAQAMGFVEPELYQSDDEMLATLMAGTGLRMSFRELALRGSVYVSAEPVIAFGNLIFPTPSSRIELASRAAVLDGHPLTAIPAIEEVPPAGFLRLITPAGIWLSNSAFANDRAIAERNGPPVIHLHPDDAASRGLQERDEAEVQNEAGSLRLQVRLMPSLLKGTALVFKNRSPKCDGDRANINRLTASGKSDMGEGTTVHSTFVRVGAVGAALAASKPMGY